MIACDQSGIIIFWFMYKTINIWDKMLSCVVVMRESSGYKPVGNLSCCQSMVDIITR